MRSSATTLDAVADVLDPHVQWYPAGFPDDEQACHSREEAVAFIRGAVHEGLTSELLDIHDAGERLVAVIHTHAPPGALVGVIHPPAPPGWDRSPEPQGRS